MTTINNLSRSETVADADLIPMWNTSEGDTRAFPASALKDSTQVGVLRADLAASTGSSLVGHIAGGTGAVARTTQAKLREAVCVFDFMTAAQVSDVQAGTLNLDVAGAVQAAIDAVYAAGGGQIWCPVGKYRLGSQILMRRGVTLIGPEHRIPTASLYGGNIEATIYGLVIFKPSAAVSTSAFHWNFQDSDKLRRPYGAQLINVMIDCDDMTSGDGVHIMHLPPGEGVFSNGWAGASTSVNGLIVTNAPRYGLYCQSSDNEKINVQILRSRFGFCGSHGIYALKCFDVKIDYCFSFDNRGDGIYMDGCATERVDDCDVFNNDGHGIVLDGFDARYTNNAVENNGKHGYLILASTTGVVDKRYRIVGGRVGTNSFDTDNTYDNIHIGDRAGTAVSQIEIANVVFGPQAHVGTTNRVRHQVHCSALATQGANIMTGCFVVGQDRKSGNPYMNDNAYQSFLFEGSVDGAGQKIVNQWRPLTAGSGAFWAPNILRGVNRFKTANTAAATLWGFNGVSGTTWIGREVFILIDDANTGVDFTGTTLKGNGGVDLAAGASTVGKILHFVCIDGTNWACQILG